MTDEVSYTVLYQQIMYVISYLVHVTDEVSCKVLYQHIMYVMSLSSSRDRRSHIQSPIAAHYVSNMFI